MKFKVGDKIKIISQEEVELNWEEGFFDGCYCRLKGNSHIFRPMLTFCGKEATIEKIKDNVITLDVDYGMWKWAPSMLKEV